MNGKELFAVEEYKLLKERINKNETRRYQILVLNVTGFAAIFGFSDKIPSPLIPFLLLTVLVVCVRQYTTQSLLQRLATAYLIEHFESTIPFLNFESGYAEYWKQRTSKSEIADPFLILTVVSLLASFFFPFNWLIEKWFQGWSLASISYCCFLVLSHLYVFVTIGSYKRQGLKDFRGWWKKYLHRPGKE